jgi:CRP/FNR family transcriptional regulator
MNKIEAVIKDLGTIKNYPKGELLFAAQDKAAGFYYVISGEIRVYKMDDDGREVEIARVGPGDFLGEAIVFVASEFFAYAQASLDSKVIYVEKNQVLRNLEQDPALAKFFLTLLAKKCVILNKRIEALGLKTVRQRLIQYLVTQCGEQESCVVELKIKKTELAKILGTISETLSRNLKQLQEEGLIDVKGSRIYVKECRALKKELAL